MIADPDFFDEQPIQISPEERAQRIASVRSQLRQSLLELDVLGCFQAAADVNQAIEMLSPQDNQS